MEEERRLRICPCLTRKTLLWLTTLLLNSALLSDPGDLYMVLCLLLSYYSVYRRSWWSLYYSSPLPSILSSIALIPLTCSHNGSTTKHPKCPQSRRSGTGCSWFATSSLQPTTARLSSTRCGKVRLCVLPCRYCNQFLLHQGLWPWYKIISPASKANSSTSELAPASFPQNFRGLQRLTSRAPGWWNQIVMLNVSPLL